MLADRNSRFLYDSPSPDSNAYTRISPTDVETAGVLLREADRYVFCYGPNASGSIYVLRIGGHVEAGESPWACAAREAKEEAGVTVTQVKATVGVRTEGIDDPVQQLPGPIRVEGYPEEKPIVLGGQLVPGERKSTLFLAETDEQARPSGEIFGLVRLTTEQVVELASTPLTFAAIATEAKPQDHQVPVADDTPLLISTHLRALAFCIELGYA